MLNVKQTRYGRCCQHTSSNETLVEKKIICQGFIFLIEINLQSVSKKFFFSFTLSTKKTSLPVSALFFRYYNINRQFIFSVQNRQFQCDWKTNILHHIPVGSRGFKPLPRFRRSPTHHTYKMFFISTNLFCQPPAGLGSFIHVMIHSCSQLVKI